MSAPTIVRPRTPIDTVAVAALGTAVAAWASLSIAPAFGPVVLAAVPLIVVSLLLSVKALGRVESGRGTAIVTAAVCLAAVAFVVAAPIVAFLIARTV